MRAYPESLPGRGTGIATGFLASRNALANPQTCVVHRAQLTDAQKNVIVQKEATAPGRMKKTPASLSRGCGHRMVPTRERLMEHGASPRTLPCRLYQGYFKTLITLYRSLHPFAHVQLEVL